MNRLQIIKLCINKIAKVFRNLFSKVAARKRPHARGGHQNFSRARGPKIEISRGRGGARGPKIEIYRGHGGRGGQTLRFPDVGRFGAQLGTRCPNWESGAQNGQRVGIRMRSADAGGRGGQKQKISAGAAGAGAKNRNSPRARRPRPGARRPRVTRKFRRARFAR